MRLEKAIKQSKFKSEHHKLYVNLMYTYNWLEEPMRKLFSKYQLTLSQYNILRILKGASPDPMSPNDIKDVMLHKKSDLTRMLDRLEKKNLVHRMICPSNRRKMDITITEEGIQLLAEILPKLEAVSEGRIEKYICTEEAAQLNDLLDKLRG